MVYLNFYYLVRSSTSINISSHSSAHDEYDVREQGDILRGYFLQHVSCQTQKIIECMSFFFFCCCCSCFATLHGKARVEIFIRRRFSILNIHHQWMACLVNSICSSSDCTRTWPSHIQQSELGRRRSMSMTQRRNSSKQDNNHSIVYSMKRLLQIVSEFSLNLRADMGNWFNRDSYKQFSIHKWWGFSWLGPVNDDVRLMKWSLN